MAEEEPRQRIDRKVWLAQPGYGFKWASWDGPLAEGGLVKHEVYRESEWPHSILFEFEDQHFAVTWQN